MALAVTCVTNQHQTVIKLWECIQEIKLTFCVMKLMSFRWRAFIAVTGLIPPTLCSAHTPPSITTIWSVHWAFPQSHLGIQCIPHMHFHPCNLRGATEGMMWQQFWLQHDTCCHPWAPALHLLAGDARCHCHWSGKRWWSRSKSELLTIPSERLSTVAWR